MYAGVVELVDTPDLGSGAARCESSSLFARTDKKKLLIYEKLFCCLKSYIQLPKTPVFIITRSF